MILIFPIMVACFTDNGWQTLTNLNGSTGQTPSEMIRAIKDQANENALVGSAISGIIMFQVILLGLMGSNNSAREIAGERLIMEKEKFAGVGSLAYVSSKMLFLSVLVLVQSLWMFCFVHYFWGFRGDVLNHLLFILLANAAMTSVCLGISANSKTADQASLLSIYLVGFQLPLSGAVLALDETLATITQPFISAYWAWSGSLSGVENTYRDVVDNIVQTDFAAYDICLIVLGAHILVGILLTYVGVRRTRWE